MLHGKDVLVSHPNVGVSLLPVDQCLLVVFQMISKPIERLVPPGKAEHGRPAAHIFAVLMRISAGSSRSHAWNRWLEP
jgi:hypothetical protein